MDNLFLNRFISNGEGAYCLGKLGMTELLSSFSSCSGRVFNVAWPTSSLAGSREHTGKLNSVSLRHLFCFQQGFMGYKGFISAVGSHEKFMATKTNLVCFYKSCAIFLHPPTRTHTDILNIVYMTLFVIPFFKNTRNVIPLIFRLFTLFIIIIIIKDFTYFLMTF